MRQTLRKITQIQFITRNQMARNTDKMEWKNHFFQSVIFIEIDWGKLTFYLISALQIFLIIEGPS